MGGGQLQGTLIEYSYEIFFNCIILGSKRLTGLTVVYAIDFSGAME